MPSKLTEKFGLALVIAAGIVLYLGMFFVLSRITVNAFYEGLGWFVGAIILDTVALLAGGLLLMRISNSSDGY